MFAMPNATAIYKEKSYKATCIQVESSNQGFVEDIDKACTQPADQLTDTSCDEENSEKKEHPLFGIFLAF